MMGSFSGSSNIFELKEKLTPVHTKKGIPPSKSNSRSDDRNQKSPVLNLHDAIENDINRLFQAIHKKNSVKSLGKSYQEEVGPSRKNAMKKPIKLGVSYGTEISEQLNLKQALRGLSISQASETAASKWLSKSVNSPRISEAGGRIKNLYKAVVVEPGQSSKRGKDVVHRNIASEATTSGRCEKGPHSPHDSKTKSLNRSANTSPRLVKSPVTRSERRPLSKKEMNPVSNESGNCTLKEMMAKPEKHEKIEGHTSKASKNKLVATKSITSIKLVNKVPNSKLAKKSPLQTVASPATSISGHNLNKVTTKSPRSVTPVRSKNLDKKNLKPELLSVSGTYDVRNVTNPANSSLICQNCQCLLQRTDSKPDQSSQSLNCSSAGAEVGLSSEMKPGTRSLLSSSSGCNSSATVPKANNTSKLKGKGEFSQSSKSSIGELSSSTSISEDSYLSGSSRGNRPHKSKDVRWEALGQVQKMHGTLGLKNFNLLKKLGYGDIGTVYLAELIGTNCPFAIKVMDIDYLSRRKKMPRAEAEREILKMLDHPFLPTLYAQFTSDNLSCLVMEYCPGGDLHVLRQKQTGRNFPEHAARFYVAEVLLAMEYLHMLGIIYRDLKPENILVREDGHIMLTDFDLSLRCDVVPTLMESSSCRSEFAKGQCTGASCIHPFCIEPSCRVPCFSPRILPAAAKARKQKHDQALLLKSLPQLVAEPTDARSNSFVGTHEYLAPEIISGEGHGSAVDWWTFGVFLFELLYGKTPFRGSGNDETLTNVVTQSLKFPDTPFVSFQARDLIKGLLVKEPENRLGSKRGAAEIKQHPFFEGLNWALIRCTAPPELPDFYDCNYGALNSASAQEKKRFLEFKTTEEHLEFELF